MVPWTMMALTSLRWTMPTSKKPAYSPFMTWCSGLRSPSRWSCGAWTRPTLGSAKAGHEVGEPVRGHGVIGVDDADDLGVGGGLRQREPQRAGLVAVEPRRVDEAEALAERAAVLFDGLPHRRARRVVDDDDALEVRIVEPRDRIERRLDHVRRLVIGGNVDRHLGRVSVRRRAYARGAGTAGRQQALRRAAEPHHRDLVDPPQRDHDERHQEQHAEREREGRAQHEVMTVPVFEHGRGPGADAVRGHGEEHGLHQRSRRPCSGSAARREPRPRRRRC